ncbi:hypothetical protein ACQJBY_060200 [Aegilops geniculata]
MRFVCSSGHFMPCVRVVLASLVIFTLMARLGGLRPPACPLGRYEQASTGQMAAMYAGSTNINVLEKPRTVKTEENMGVQGHILYS